jgi:RHS repeat-associated protein
MQVPNRFASIEDYRYGFQGQEKDDEVKGEGNSLNYTFRMHDPRVGRFFALDPLTKKYPYYSPYSFSGNKVIRYVELEGLEEGNPDHFDGWTNVGDKSSPAIQDVSSEEMNRRNSAFISVVTAPVMLLKPVQFCVTAYAMGDLNLAIDKSEDARQAELSGDFQKAQTLKNEVGDLSKSAIFEAVGSGIGYSLSRISFGLKGAKFAQNGNHSEVFSDSGQMIYSELVGFKITTIDDLANAIKNGDVLVENIPVQYVVRNGENVILNTRTSAALNRAGIPMEEWHGVDVTGVPHPVYKGETFDYAAEKQINKNYKPGEELSSIPPK